MTVGSAVPPVTVSATAGAVTVRRAVPGDRDELTRMFGRCTPLTRCRRFHASVKAIPGRYLADALAGGPLHYALVARLDPDPGAAPDPGDDPDRGSLVALASCRVCAEGAAELGLLVEDAWQGRGLGHRLLGDMVAHAAGAGLRVLTAQVLGEQAWLAGQLARYGAARIRVVPGGVLTVTVRLPARPGAERHSGY